MGSEMCIRDSDDAESRRGVLELRLFHHAPEPGRVGAIHRVDNACLLYTSDAADERSSVDLGGRRIIKKKNTL